MLLFTPLLPAAAAANGPARAPEPASRRELARAEVQLKRQLARLPADSGVQVLRRPDGVVLRVPARVLFAPDSATLRRGDASATRALTVAARLLQRRRRLAAQIDVYTDDIGGAALNLGFSEQRAQALAAALHAAGVAAIRIRAHGEGLADALASNDTPEGRIRNRRVEIVFESAGALAAEAPARPVAARTPAAPTPAASLKSGLATAPAGG